MKYAFLFLTYMICSGVSIWGTLHFAPQTSAIRMLEAEGQKEWPYYANYAGSYSESAGVPINRAVAMSLGGNERLGVEDKPDLAFEGGSKFKENVRNFAL